MDKNANVGFLAKDVINMFCFCLVAIVIYGFAFVGVQWTSVLVKLPIYPTLALIFFGVCILYNLVSLFQDALPKNLKWILDTNIFWIFEWIWNGFGIFNVFGKQTETILGTIAMVLWSIVIAGIAVLLKYLLLSDVSKSITIYRRQQVKNRVWKIINKLTDPNDNPCIVKEISYQPGYDAIVEGFFELPDGKLLDFTIDIQHPELLSDTLGIVMDHKRQGLILLDEQTHFFYDILEK